VQLEELLIYRKYNKKTLIVKFYTLFFMGRFYALSGTGPEKGASQYNDSYHWAAPSGIEKHYEEEELIYRPVGRLFTGCPFRVEKQGANYRQFFVDVRIVSAYL